MPKFTKFLLLLIILLALSLRVYKLDSVPPSLSWDETAVGYNAWSIANWGKDEYGKSYPLFFRSFEDDKHPIHVYITAIFIKIFGPSEFSVRLPAAIFGVLNVFLLFLVGRVMFKSNAIGLAAALFLAVSAYNIHFSHFNHEVNFALFFFLLGLVLFLRGLEKSKLLLSLSFIGFGLSLLAYHSSKVVVPPILLILILINFKKLLKIKRFFLSGLIILIFFVIIIFLNPPLLGTARVQQNKLSTERLRETKLYQITKNELLAWLEITYHQYWWHFSPQYLFVQGDKNPRLSSQMGEFYKLDAIFLIFGVIYLLYKRSKESVILLSWALFAPLPSALVAEAPHAARAMYMMGSWHLIAAVGLYSIIKLCQRRIFKIVILVAVFIILALSLQKYLGYYFGEYTKRYAIEWQYGMKQIVEFVNSNPEYNEVNVTDARSQPYIFFLYYLKTPLPQYLRTVIYNRGENKSYNNVAHFDRYYFGGWDPVESKPIKGVLYVLTPSQYDGLKYKLSFDIKKKILYPNGIDAFYLVSVI